MLIFLSACGGNNPAPAVTPNIQVITLTPRNGATAAPINAPTRIPATNHELGPKDAFLTVIMYGDFQCDLCLEVARNLAILRDKYSADVRLIFRHFPQQTSVNGTLASQAAEAAAAQGKFWEMHDQLYAHQPEWKALPIPAFRAKLDEYASTVGLDAGAFKLALDDGSSLKIVQQSVADAEALQLKGVPALLFNGQPYSGRVDLWALENYFNLMLLEKRWYKAQPPLEIDVKKKYRATLKTEKGDIVIDLFTDAAPVAANNFVALARDGWYDNITFHLVMPGQLVQTGDPSGSGYGGPGYSILDERDNGLIFDREGLVAMASTRGVPNSAGSQFFITLAPLRPAQDYDKQFTIFGIVTKGMDVLRKLTPRNQFDEARFPNPQPGDKLISITITEQ
jgi:cyclophilin family peptidyl-prolyl cis-trans isomerase/protein-disulfide isomerase